MLIGVDIDDVLADTMGALCAFHNERYGTSLEKGDFHSLHFERIWGGTEQGADEKILEFLSSSYFKGMQPMPGSREITRRLSGSHDLFLATARRKELVKTTLYWVGSNYPGTFQQINFTNEWHRYDGVPVIRKSDICMDFGVDILIEDNLETALECAHNGTRALLMNQPWNQAPELPPLVARVYDWDDILEKIQK